MPFIDSKVTVKASDEQKKRIKEELGKAISIMHKPETYLMVGIEDNYTLYFAGEKLDRGAFVSVDVFGKPSSADCSKMTASICSILQKELSIPPDKVYVRYMGTNDWGWNGSNF